MNTPPRLRRSVPALAAVAALLALAGCGAKSAPMAPVRGKVLLNGQPLTTGRVITNPAAGRGANGIIGADGAFELKTYNEGDGALVGKHNVAVVAYDGKAAGPEAPQGKLLVPQRYTNDMTSNLSIDVKADEENAPIIELTSP